MATLQQEVAKLISARLLKGESIALPGVGTLYIERRAARRVSSTLIEPPCRLLRFKSSIEGVTLQQEIQRIANCSEEEARDVYERWVEKCREDKSLTIEGICAISGVAIVVDEEFIKRLNPHGSAPVKVLRRMPWWVWSTLTIVGVAALTALLVWLVNPLEIWNRYKERSVKVVSNEQIVPIGVDTLKVERADSTVKAAPIVERVDSLSKPKVEVQTSLAPSDVITRTARGKSYVVLGIFSTEKNARRALSNAVTQHSIEESLLRIFYYGDKYLVSIGEYDSSSSAHDVARQYRAKGLGDGIWVYTK